MKLERMTIARARFALGEAMRGWVFDPNVALIGLGWPERGGKLIKDELAIRIHVKKKYSGFALEAAVGRGHTGNEIPKVIGDFRTDVLEGSYRPHQWWWWGSWPRQAINPRTTRAVPMRGGISISNERQYTYATLGALVRDRSTQSLMCLSNWHVLAGHWGARPGQRIYQPGRRDGGSSADTIATLTRDAMSDNLDAAVATLTGQRQLINDQLELGPISGVRQAELGMKVVKSGRQTKVTYGRVTDIEAITTMTYSGLTRIIRSVTVIDQLHPFEEVSAGGDSGSMWLDDATRQAIGLHFAGSNDPERALAVDMQSVLDALNVELVTT